MQTRVKWRMVAKPLARAERSEVMKNIGVVSLAWMLAASAAVAGGPPKTLVELCGVLGPGPQGCTVVQGFHGRAYPIANTGPFRGGDVVFVSGTLVEDSTLCFPVVLPAIEDNTIEPCFAGCGTLQMGPQGCIIFVPDQGGPGFVLENLGDASIGDRIYVEGPIRGDSSACFPFVEVLMIENNLALECFTGCGTLAAGIVCNVFVADSGEVYALSNFGPFAPVERVFVLGGIEPDSPYCNDIPQPGIRVRRIDSCGVGPDLNGDGVVNGADLALLLSSFGECPSPLVAQCFADINGDGVVNGADLAKLLSAWGPVVGLP